MPLMRNTVTGKEQFMPASYVGQFPFVVVEEIAEPVVVEVAKPKKKKAEYKADVPDADGDGLVQDGTIFERPAGTELSPEQVTEILAGTEE